MRVTWTQHARLHLTDIRNYIAANSPRYAQRTIDGIMARAKQLTLFPHSGSIVIEYGNPEIREVIEGSYRVIYRVKDEVVEILAVIHGARQLPPLK